MGDVFKCWIDLDVLLKHIYKKADDDNDYVGDLKGSFNGNSGDLVESKLMIMARPIMMMAIIMMTMMMLMRPERKFRWQQQ